MKSYNTMLVLVLIAVVALVAIFRDDRCPTPQVVMGRGGPGTATIPGIHIEQDIPR
jgi:hypothetical protein